MLKLILGALLIAGAALSVHAEQSASSAAPSPAVSDDFDDFDTSPTKKIDLPATAETKKTSAPAVSPSSKGRQYFESEGMVVSKYWDWDIDGVITGDKDKKILISQGDTVYIRTNSAKFKPGVQGTIYRKIGRVRDPDKAEDGFEIRRIGRIETTRDADGKFITAKVVVSYEPVEIGDVVIVKGGK